MNDKKSYEWNQDGIDFELEESKNKNTGDCVRLWVGRDVQIAEYNPIDFALRCDDQTPDGFLYSLRIDAINIKGLKESDAEAIAKLLKCDIDNTCDICRKKTALFPTSHKDIENICWDCIKLEQGKGDATI